MAIPWQSVEEVSTRFANTLYDYFIGKRLVFPIVENYVKNTWAKFGSECNAKKWAFFFNLLLRRAWNKSWKMACGLLGCFPLS